MCPAPPESDTKRPARPPAWQRWLGPAIIVLFLLATLPLSFKAMGPSGIDPSHTWAINAGFAKNLSYGHELVFTYGPFGFIAEPLDMGHNLLIANLARLGLHLVLGIGLYLQLRRGQSLARFGTGLLLLSLAWSFFDLALAAITTVTVWCQLAARRQRWLLLLVAAALAGLLPLIKLSLGVTAGATLAMACLTGEQRWRRDPRTWFAAATAALVFAVAALLSLGSLNSINLWLARSLQIVSGYSAAMSMPGPDLELAAGLVLLLAWLLATALFRRRPELGTMSAILLPAVVISFKLGFVRHDVHVYNFFGMLLGALALMVLVARSGRRALSLGLAFVVVLAVAGAGSLEVMPHLRGMPRHLCGAAGLSSLARLARLSDTKQRLAEQSRRNIVGLALPEPWLEPLRSSRNGVGTLPWENLYCPANRLRWSPTPTCQLYQAFTRRLDTWSASRYASANHAPQFIVVHQDPVGMRHPLFDAPATWIEILSHYRLRASQRERGLLLLERLDSPRLDPPQELGTGTLFFQDRGVEVPAASGLVLAGLELRTTRAGALQRTLFRIPPVFLVLYRASGQSETIRLVPDVAAHGLLVNRFPHLVPNAWEALWTGAPIDPVVRISLAGPGTALLQEPVQVRWMVLMRRPPEAGALQSRGRSSWPGLVRTL